MSRLGCNGKDDGDGSKRDFARIPAEEGMIELRSHRKDGVEEIDRQRLQPPIYNKVSLILLVTFAAFFYYGTEILEAFGSIEKSCRNSRVLMQHQQEKTIARLPQSYQSSR